MLSPPENIQQLQQRAQALAGLTIAQAAAHLGEAIPDNLSIEKGWQGQFIERCLGADAGNQARPDFSLLDIELKTLPIDHHGNVQESTYVSVVEINKRLAQQWRDSVVYHKLKHVLWVPIASEKGAPTSQSRIATPFFWKMDQQQEELLQSDWEHAMEIIALGKIHQLNARMGEILQVRPKAANSRVLTDSINERGEQSQTLPRGFYLRSTFTQSLLDRYLIR